MPNWDLDPALFLTPRFQMQAPAEELACVICSTSSRETQAQTLCVVDVNPTSGTYSEVIGEIALEPRDESPYQPSRERKSRLPLGNAGCAAPREVGRKIAPRILLAHNAEHRYGFSTTGFSLHDLSSAISIWYRDGGQGEVSPWDVRTVIEIPAEPGSADRLPALLRPAAAVPPLITDLALSVDDCYLYVACWGTGCLKQFDVSDPFIPREIASVRIGGIANRAAHPSRAGSVTGGPCSVTLSRDGRRLYLTNALSPSWDARLYPEGIQGWLVKLDIDPGGGLAFDPNFFVDFGSQRPLQVRLQGQGPG